jgi:hypothetical protein
MDLTRIQKLLGHTQLSTTQIYAQLLDATLEADYRRAMTHIEQHSPPLADQPVAVEDWPVRQVAEYPILSTGGEFLGQMAD